MVHFSNVHHEATSVCFRDSLGGDIFTITDKTDGSNGLILNGFTAGNEEFTVIENT